MCDPVSIGIGTFVVGAVSAVGSYVQQQQQVEYANAQAEAQSRYQNQVTLFQAAQQNRSVSLANQQQAMQTFLQRQNVANQNLQTQLDYQAQLQQRSYQGLQDQLAYQVDLNKSIASQQYVNTQLTLNKEATSRAMMAEQQKLNDAQAQAAFEGQRLLATNLQTQGTVLSSGRTGQSIGLLVNDAERRYGQDSAILNRNADMAYGDYQNNSAMAVLRQLSADAEATSRLLPEPIKPMSLPSLPKPVLADLPEYGPTASYLDSPGPMSSPVFASGPSPIGLIAGIGGSVLGGIGAGYQQAAILKSL